MSNHYRKKPVVIEAIQWDGFNLKNVIALAGLHPSAKKWSWGEYEKIVAQEGLKVFTQEGPLFAPVGHWIVRAANGDVWPVSDEYFSENYEPALTNPHDVRQEGK